MSAQWWAMRRLARRRFAMAARARAPLCPPYPQKVAPRGRRACAQRAGDASSYSAQQHQECLNVPVYPCTRVAV